MGLRQVRTRLEMNSCFAKSTWGEVLPEAGIFRSPERVKLTNNKNMGPHCAKRSMCSFDISHNRLQC